MIATARGEDKLAVCRERGGADFAVDYSKGGWQKEVMDITKGKGVDVVFDPVVSAPNVARGRWRLPALHDELTTYVAIGQGMLIPSLKVAGWKCRLVVVGFAGGTIEKVRPRPFQRDRGPELTSCRSPPLMVADPCEPDPRQERVNRWPSLGRKLQSVLVPLRSGLSRRADG